VPGSMWLIPVLPFAASAVLLFFGRRLGAVLGPLVGAAATGTSFVLSLLGLLALRGGAPAYHAQIRWAEVGDLSIRMGFMFDKLEAAVVTMVTFASFFIQLYAMGYMRGDAKYNRFFTIVSLFTAGMLTTVMADNLLLFTLGWEIMGFASFSLIGHWFEKIENAWAAFKAFVTTRIGDLGLMAAMFLLAAQAGTLQFDGIFEAVEGAAGAWWVTLAALFLFWAAVGKSAQLPLHVWLPDAMAGPTPVSALIHAATMVAAGVFLVARNYALFEASGTALDVVAWVGGVTLLFAAVVAVLQEDIKKVLAYSTMSQLGYMMMALGVGGYAAGVFHVVTHGFFKALLFLGAGSVIHALHHEQNMHRMGGLFRRMPVTAVTFIIGMLALAGIPPFAGYYSKDEILLAAYEANSALFWIGSVGALLTAFYMTRAVVLTFFGRPRDKHVFEHAHESPAVMTVPLLALAVPSLLYGLLAPQLLGQPVHQWLAFGGHAAHHEPSSFVMAVATGVAVAGILLGAVVFGVVPAASRKAVISALRPLYTVIKNKFYFDELYQAVFVRGTRALAGVAGVVDRYVIDGLVNGAAALTVFIGSQTRRLTNGFAQAYMLVLVGGVVLGIIVFQAIGG